MRICTRKLFCFFAGLFGALAFVAYAVGAHIDGYYEKIATILAPHALALLTIALAAPEKHLTPKISGYGFIIGSFLFCIDLFLRQNFHKAFFPYAAPIGGLIVIFSWAILCFLAFTLQKNYHGKD